MDAEFSLQTTWLQFDEVRRMDGSDRLRHDGRHLDFWALGDRIGRKPSFLLFQAGAVFSIIAYSQLTDPNTMLIAGAFLGMFVNGMMGGYGALMAEAYPTQARATAQNVLFNLGRAVGGFGPVAVGAVVSACSFQTAIAFFGGDLCHRYVSNSVFSAGVKKAKSYINAMKVRFKNKCFFTALFHINKTVKNKKPLWVLSKAAFSS